MSFKLFGIAHRKNSTVTTRNGNSRPAGINCASMSSLFCDGAFPCAIGPPEMFKMISSSWNGRCNEARLPMLSIC